MALTGHWKFDDNAASTAVVATVGSNGTCTDNTSTMTGIGPTGKSLRFNGVDQEIDLGTPTIGASVGSFGCWVMSPASGVDEYIFGQQDTHNRMYLRYDTSSSVVMIGLGENSNIDTTKSLTGLFSKWCHLFVTYSSGTWVFYFNSVQVKTDTYTGTIVNSDEYPIGNAEALESWWTGGISDVRIYSTALSAVDVKTLYNSVVPAVAQTNPIHLDIFGFDRTIATGSIAVTSIVMEGASAGDTATFIDNNGTEVLRLSNTAGSGSKVWTPPTGRPFIFQNGLTLDDSATSLGDADHLFIYLA